MNEQLELPVQWRTEFISGLVITPAWYGLRQQVKHLAQFGGSAQVVYGPKGSGKTTFLLFLQEDEEWDLFAVDALPKRSFDVFLGNILDVLGCPRPESGGVGEGLAELRRYVQQLERDQARAVLGIDNADQLEDAAIAALVSVLQGSQDLGFGLHWLFVSRPGLAERIDRLQLLDIEVSDVALPNFSPSELQTLLTEAKKHRRLPGHAQIEQVQRIWVQASGWPGPALDIAAHTGAANDNRKGEPPRRAWPVSHVAALTILLAVLLWAVLVRDRDLSTSNNAQSAGEREVQTLALPRTNDAEGADDGVFALDAAAGLTGTAENPSLGAAGTDEQSIANGVVATPEQPVVAAGQGVEETGLNFDQDPDASFELGRDPAEPALDTASAAERSIAPPAEASAAVNAPLSSLDTAVQADEAAAQTSPVEATELAGIPEATSAAESNATAGAGTVSSAVARGPKENRGPEEASVPEETRGPEETRASEETAVPASEADRSALAGAPATGPDTEAVGSPGEASTAGQVYTNGETHLLGLPSGSYVLQLMAISSLEKMQAFVTAQPNADQLHIYRALRNGQQLYILVEGVYDSRRAAQAGIANLPASQRRGGPWPKSAGQIQEEIRRLNDI